MAEDTVRHERCSFCTNVWAPTDCSCSGHGIGYRDAFAEMKIPVNPDFIKAESFTAEYAYVAVSGLLCGRHRPTAIVAGGISMLTGMLRACSTERLRIPQDISIIGCGDSADPALYDFP